MSEQKCLSVAIIGETNSGKSTLINHIIGKKVAIVTPKAQTTRNRIVGIKNIDNTQLILVDTPGIFREVKRKGDEALLEIAWQNLNEAEVSILLIDILSEQRETFGSNNRKILDRLSKNPNKKIILVLNKIDLLDKATLLPIIKKFVDAFNFNKVFCVSALKGDGVQDLENYLVSIAPKEPHHYIDDEISDMPERLFASEITREKLMLNLKQELPYSFKVEVEKWEETPKQLKIYQVIFVGNDNHKKIILGSNGEMIKTIGIQSRLELEAIFEKKVSLFLHLKVRPKELEG